jgi:hypothetical protein
MRNFIPRLIARVNIHAEVARHFTIEFTDFVISVEFS